MRVSPQLHCWCEAELLLHCRSQVQLGNEEVDPGFFRTELLTEQSTNFAEASISDYDERRAQQLEFWKTQNGLQSGDPAKLGERS